MVSFAYNRPKEGSLTEMRGQKANLHVYKEMLDLCEVINESGLPRSESEPEMKYILFGELFNVSIILQSRKKFIWQCCIITTFIVIIITNAHLVYITAVFEKLYPIIQIFDLNLLCLKC